MGILADSFRSRLTDLKRRSAETELLVLEAQRDLNRAIAEMDRAAADLRHL